MGLASISNKSSGFVFDTLQWGGESFVEAQAWGDIVDPRENLNDTPGWFGGIASAPPISRLEDRLNGDYLPIYQTEMELAQIWGIAHSLLAFEPRALGVVELLGNYIIGTGFTFSAQVEVSEAENVPAGLSKVVQKFIDEFLDQNDFHNDLDKEIHARSREDGEAPVALEPSRDGIPSIRLFEPNQITQPRRDRDLEEYVEHVHHVDCSGPTDWKYGVHTPHQKPYQVLGYHLVYGGTGDDWDYYPADRFELFKRNVKRNAKRGVSDFHWVWSEMGNEAKLRRNTVTGATIQAAIAFIREHAAGTTQAQAAGLVTSGRSGVRNESTYGGGTRQVSAVHYPPGKILDVSAGLQYKPGPMGAERNSSLLLPGEYILRCIGARWQTPEYMISNDASNGNFASTLVSESPFVKARESDQEWYAKRFLSLIWKAMKMGHAAGWFERNGVNLPWDVLMKLVDIKCDPPEVATRNRMDIANEQNLKIQNGTLSVETAIAEDGRDPAEELPKIEAERQKRIASEATPAPAPAPLPAGQSAIQGAIQGAMESVETSSEVRELLQHLSEKVYP